MIYLFPQPKYRVTHIFLVFVFLYITPHPALVVGVGFAETLF